MHQMSSSNSIVIHEIPGRHVTVVQGNSGVVYPFYRSTGINSQNADTWLPWMGYFDAHPEQEKNIDDKNSIYMVKPNTYSLSLEMKTIIKKHLNDPASFIARLGNDEALAISCSIGNGVWTKYPHLKEEIMDCESLQKYLKTIEISEIQRTSLSVSKDKLVQFNGRHYTGIVRSFQAVIAVKMEHITEIESKKYASIYSVQAKEYFPSTEELDSLYQLTNTPPEVQTTPTSGLENFGFMKPAEKKQPDNDAPSNAPSLNL